MNEEEYRFPEGISKNKEIKIDIPVVDNTESSEAESFVIVLRARLISRIESVTSTIIQQICSGQLPKISYSEPQNFARMDTQTSSQNESSNAELRSSSEEQSDEETEPTEKKVVTNFAASRSKEKFALMMTVMATAHRLLITKTTATRRSLYYDLKTEKTSSLSLGQGHVDRAVNHVANLLNCAPWELNILPTSKGLAAGELTLTLIDNRSIDCSVPGGALIPQIVSNVTSVRTTAKMVLVVEKDAVFQKLLEDDCTGSLNCILLTGKGYPDVATRMLVKLLAEKLGLPVYVVVDADPFGVDIMCVYRFGSATLSKENESLVCSSVRWLGILPSELHCLGVNTLPLTEFDRSKLAAIETRPYMTDSFLKELEIMRKGKAEIESVSSFSRKFLTSTYLPCKIKGHDYI
ncbi:meiotic W68 [Osmia lignaria lignaria]|uniref:meiotic W68 n=1 Tax=Osmia lignaria lignaria TaxID=1437193 RepID=UPI00402BE248